MSIRTLKYRVIDPQNYVDDDVVEHKDCCAVYILANGLLEAQLHLPAESVAQARTNVDPIVRSWEFESEVRMGFPVIKFDFLPAPSAEAALSSQGPHEAPSEDPHLVIQSRYPQGPSIRATPDMENVWTRFTRARMGIGESLQSAVYFGLTVIEARFGSRTKASASLNLAPQILSGMGELSSTRGDSKTARKACATVSPLNRQEVHWLDCAFRHALLQLGMVEAGLVPPAVALTDLPSMA